MALLRQMELHLLVQQVAFVGFSSRREICKPGIFGKWTIPRNGGRCTGSYQHNTTGTAEARTITESPPEKTQNGAESCRGARKAWLAQARWRCQVLERSNTLHSGASFYLLYTSKLKRGVPCVCWANYGRMIVHTYDRALSNSLEHKLSTHDLTCLQNSLPLKIMRYHMESRQASLPRYLQMPNDTADSQQFLFHTSRSDP